MLLVDIKKRRGEFSMTLTLSAPHGIVALFGRSGCGKSTAINLIAGLLRPDAGQIRLGEEILFDAERGINVAPEQRRIGYVFQDARLFPHYSVRGNLQYGQRRARTAGYEIHFERVVDLLDLRPLLERRPLQLSGGERQRVAIGRALLSQPQLLLLDEPLASLDMARREEVLPYLERLRDELSMPMVYVSHQYEEVLRLANQVVLMERGEVLVQGTLPAISMRPDLRALIGPDAIGTVIEGTVVAIDSSGLAQVSVGHGRLLVDSQQLVLGQRVRLQLLARDLILATESPRGLSVRNALQGTVIRLTPDDRSATLVDVDIGGLELTARITTLAVDELALRPGLALWVLVKAITLRGRVFDAPVAHAQAPSGA